MAFLKRLGFYLFGLSIGIVFLTIFLKKKSEETGVSFCYFPNCRTLKDIRSKPLVYSDQVNDLVKDRVIDSTDINYILTQGEVDFGRSDTKSVGCKTYLIEGILDNQEIEMEVKNCSNEAIIQQLIKIQ
ncbi:DUF4258 domain-containing protein [Maribacter sp. CXY002]|uniref:DUF4258 domain-containing protein n=1 Tax=Maribacter luteocoastalis TaxID=3407671 RepID=UPI003B684569